MSNTGRKNQREKSQKMRLRLIEATLDCLQIYGFHGASLSKILEKAGVSRGAWRHHYATKNELVAAASEHLLSTALNKARTFAETIETDRGTGDSEEIADILDAVWSQFYQGRYRDIWIEFNVACRTDRELNEILSPVIRSFFNEMDTIWSTRISRFSRTEIKAETVMNLCLYILRGMSFQSLSMDNEKHYKDVRKAWAEILSGMLVKKPDIS